MNLRRLVRPLGFLVVLIAALAVGGELLYQHLFGLSFLRPKIYDLDVAGRIVDRWGNSVPGAHVLVKTYAGRIKGSTICFGVVADARGSFHIIAKCDDHLKQEVQVVAMGADNYSGYSPIVIPEVIDGRMTADVGAVTLTTSPQAQTIKGPSFEYATFCGFCNVVHFDGRGWSVFP